MGGGGSSKSESESSGSSKAGPSSSKSLRSDSVLPSASSSQLGDPGISRGADGVGRGDRSAFGELVDDFGEGEGDFRFFERGGEFLRLKEEKRGVAVVWARDGEWGLGLVADSVRVFGEFGASGRWRGDRGVGEVDTERDGNPLIFLRFVGDEGLSSTDGSADSTVMGRSSSGRLASSKDRGTGDISARQIVPPRNGEGSNDDSVPCALYGDRLSMVEGVETGDKKGE